MIEFKTVQFLAHAKSGSAVTQTKTVDFAAHVQAVQPAIQGFDLSYDAGDHPTLRQFVQVVRAAVQPGDDCKVDVTVSFGLRDASGAAFDDPYGGRVDVLLIAHTAPLLAAGPAPLAPDLWVALRTSTGRFLTVDGAGTLTTTVSTDPSAPPRFRIVMLDAVSSSVLADHHLVAIQWRDPVNGQLRYGSAEQGGGGRVTFDRTEVREWETFELRRPLQPPGSDRRWLAFGDTVSLRSWGRRFLCAPAGAGPVAATADRFRVQDWETFTLA